MSACCKINCEWENSLPHVMLVILKAIWHYKLWVFIWVWIMSFVMIAGIIVSITSNDFIGWSLIVAICIIAPYNGWLGLHYQGITKNMGWFHIIPLTLFIIYDFLRLVGAFNTYIKDETSNYNDNDSNDNNNENNDKYGWLEQLTYKNNPSGYVFGIIALIIFIICILFDVFDTYTWFIIKNRNVIRDPTHLQKMIKNGKLPKNTKQIQQLMYNGEIKYDTNLCDEWGLLKTANQGNDHTKLTE